MANQTVGVSNLTAGDAVSLVDVSELTVGNTVVERQRINLADPTAPGNIALVTSAGALQVDPSAVTAIGDLTVSIKTMLNMLSGLPLAQEPGTARLRVVLDPLGGAQTLGTVTTVGTVTAVTAVTSVSAVTTVGTVTKLSQVGSAGFDASSMIFDAMMNCWATNVRGNIT